MEDWLTAVVRLVPYLIDHIQQVSINGTGETLSCTVQCFLNSNTTTSTQVLADGAGHKGSP